MKTIISIMAKGVFLSISLILLISCEEVIELDLQSSESQLVIEGVITDDVGPYSVKILRSTDFYEPSTFEKVPGAVVIITDDMGVTDTLTEAEPGHYLTNITEGMEGVTYHLLVCIDDEHYQAVATMPTKIHLDSISNEYLSTPHGSGQMVFCHFIDQKEVKNYIRIRTFLNNELENNSITVFEDKLFEDGKAKLPVIQGPDNLFETGDFLKIELLTINYDTYIYYKTLSKEIVGEESGMMQGTIHGKTAPANPVTNISNGALGYFTAYCLSTDEIVIK